MSANLEVAHLLWWRENARKFPYISFLAQHIPTIPSSQIETMHTLSIPGVFTTCDSVD